MKFFWSHLYSKKLRSYSQEEGFTLFEVLIVVVMVGILAVIAGPNWFGYLSRRRVVTTRDDVYQTILQAQATAKQRSVSYQVSFRKLSADDPVEWSVHPKGTPPSLWQAAPAESIEIDTACGGGALDPIAGDVIEFDFKGNVREAGTLYFANGESPAVGEDDPTLSAIDFATLIGGLRKVNKQCV